MTQQQQLTPPQLAQYLGIELTTLKVAFERMRDKGTITGSWSKNLPLTPPQQTELIKKYKGNMTDNTTPPPSVSNDNTEQQQRQQQAEAERQQREQQQRQQQAEAERQQREQQQRQQQAEAERQQREQQQATDYDKRPLAAFCFSLFVVNLIVVLPNVASMPWYTQIGGVMVCSFAPFLEYRYSHILIEIWAKAKIERQGILRYFYTEGLAVVLLIPAMIFQAHDVFKLSETVLKPEGYFESALPVFLAFSYQLFGLMQTLHLPKKQKG